MNNIIFSINIWFLIFDLINTYSKYLGCDCYEHGTKYCLKGRQNYCQCKDGYEGKKCNQLSHVVMVNSQASQNEAHQTGLSYLLVGSLRNISTRKIDPRLI